MAELKRQTFLFSTDKAIRLYGTGFGITKSLEIGEAFAPNIYSLFEGQEDNKHTATVSNPHKLTAEEIIELADYSIRQWMDLKDSVRKHGVDNPKVFNRENIRLYDDAKSEAAPKKEGKSNHPKEKNNGKADVPANPTSSSKDEKAGKNSSSIEDATGNDAIGN